MNNKKENSVKVLNHVTQQVLLSKDSNGNTQPVLNVDRIIIQPSDNGKPGLEVLWVKVPEGLDDIKIVVSNSGVRASRSEGAWVSTTPMLISAYKSKVVLDMSETFNNSTPDNELLALSNIMVTHDVPVIFTTKKNNRKTLTALKASSFIGLDASMTDKFYSSRIKSSQPTQLLLANASKVVKNEIVRDNKAMNFDEYTKNVYALGEKPIDMSKSKVYISCSKSVRNMIAELVANSLAK